MAIDVACAARPGVPLFAPLATHIVAVERDVTGAGIARASARVHRISLTTWGWMFAGEAAPTGPARRGAKPPAFPVAVIDDPVLPEVLAELAPARADEMDADTATASCPTPATRSAGGSASAARADEVLCLNVEDPYPQDERGKITATPTPRWKPRSRGAETETRNCSLPPTDMTAALGSPVSGALQGHNRSTTGYLRGPLSVRVWRSRS
ncbi:hypothetical protein [Streptomyces sp. NBC_01166]|uniref:hypothetical protein n=1 Tax=Streptomyces sp. NBC_01166 TaxID=2903755 RepID=UPI0038686D27